jgi:transcriptional regulator with XRE-family HTH domain
MNTKVQEFRNFGDFIRSERQRLRMTQADFATIGRVSKTTQVSYESNETEPQAGYLARLAEAGADATWILTGRSAPSEVKWEMLFEIEDLVEEWADEQSRAPTKDQKRSMRRALYNQFCVNGSIKPEEVQSVFRIAG